MSSRILILLFPQEGGRVETDHDFTFAKTNALLDEVLEKYNARLEKRKSSDIIVSIIQHWFIPFVE